MSYENDVGGRCDRPAAGMRQQLRRRTGDALLQSPVRSQHDASPRLRGASRRFAVSGLLSDAAKRGAWPTSRRRACLCACSGSMESSSVGYTWTQKRSSFSTLASPLGSKKTRSARKARIEPGTMNRTSQDAVHQARLNPYLPSQPFSGR